MKPIKMFPETAEEVEQFEKEHPEQVELPESLKHPDFLIERTELTYQQKLHALANRFYSYQQWEPKKGDYYTTTRADLQLYRIINEDDSFFYTVYCDPAIQGNYPPSQWKKDEFLQHFGINRCYVPDWVFNY